MGKEGGGRRQAPWRLGAEQQQRAGPTAPPRTLLAPWGCGSPRGAQEDLQSRSGQQSDETALATPGGGTEGGVLNLWCQPRAPQNRTRQPLRVSSHPSAPQRGAHLLGFSKSLHTLVPELPSEGRLSGCLNTHVHKRVRGWHPSGPQAWCGSSAPTPHTWWVCWEPYSRGPGCHMEFRWAVIPSGSCLDHPVVFALRPFRLSTPDGPLHHHLLSNGGGSSSVTSQAGNILSKESTSQLGPQPRAR